MSSPLDGEDGGVNFEDGSNLELGPVLSVLTDEQKNLLICQAIQKDPSMAELVLQKAAEPRTAITASPSGVVLSPTRVSPLRSSGARTLKACAASVTRTSTSTSAESGVDLAGINGIDFAGSSGIAFARLKRGAKTRER